MAIGIITVFAACDATDEGWMSCHYAQMNVFYIGIVIAVLALVGAFINKELIRVVCAVANIVLAVVAAVMPGIIVGLCMMDTMRCHMLMRPFAIIMSVIIIIFEVVSLIFGRNKQVAEA